MCSAKAGERTKDKAEVSSTKKEGERETGRGKVTHKSIPNAQGEAGDTHTETNMFFNT